MKDTQTLVKGRFLGGALFEPKEGEDKRSANIVLIDGEDSKVDTIVEAAIAAKWGKKKPKGLQVWAAREGDDEEYEHSFGKKFINPKSKRPISVTVKRNGAHHVVTAEDDIVYPGCYVAAAITAYAYDGDVAKGIKPGVSLSIDGVMKMKDGERLSYQFDAEDVFGGISDTVEAANDDDDAWLDGDVA